VAKGHIEFPTPSKRGGASAKFVVVADDLTFALNVDAIDLVHWLQNT